MEPNIIGNDMPYLNKDKCSYKEDEKKERMKVKFIRAEFHTFI